MPQNNVYINGQIVPAEQARVSVSDAGLLHGASAFVTMVARHGRVFRAPDHIDRLFEAVRLLSIHTDADPDVLMEEADELLRINRLDRAAVRITLTPGDVRGDRPTTIITAEPLPDYPRAWYEQGIPVVVASLKQVPGEPTMGVQTGCYLPRVLARQEAAWKGAEEALWLTPDGRLAEACFANVFLVREGTVRTPPRDTPVVPGVTRQVVLELCGALGVSADAETPLRIDDLLAADEVFLTASCPGIRPVVRVERRAVGTGQPGPVTGRLMRAYEELLERECASAGDEESHP